MHRSRSFGAPAFAAAAAFAVGLVSAGPLATSASAAASASASVVNRTLQVTGTNGNDVVALQADATSAFVSFAGDVHRFTLTDFDAINVFLDNGNDQFTEQAGVLTDKPLTVNGGHGDDNIRTGDGADTIFGDNGNDLVDAGRGNDTVSLGNEDDTFTWNPGEGSDSVDGGNGNDVMQFNGSNADETMSLAANGSRAVFLRDVAGIRMDMDHVENFNLRALGGADNITIDNLQGTSLLHANLDLSDGLGSPDTQADTVIVNGTNGADSVHVTVSGGQVDVGGLPAETRISGSDTLDHLQVMTLGGNDNVTVDPNVATVIGVGVDLGTGQI